MTSQEQHSTPHTHTTNDDDNDDNTNHSRVPPFTKPELHIALRQLKAGKAADSNGIFAEMLQHGGDRLRTVLLDSFNAILQPSAPTPKSWQHTIIKVLHKSGDPKLPSNYRPIATIPILINLFSRPIYNRIEPTLDKQQSRDQAGFRKGRSTVDHLFTISMVQEISDEWQIPLWLAAVDFKKAFEGCHTTSSGPQWWSKVSTPPMLTSSRSSTTNKQQPSAQTR